MHDGRVSYRGNRKFLLNKLYLIHRTLFVANFNPAKATVEIPKK